MWFCIYLLTLGIFLKCYQVKESSDKPIYNIWSQFCDQTWSSVLHNMCELVFFRCTYYRCRLSSLDGFILYIFCILFLIMDIYAFIIRNNCKMFLIYKTKSKVSLKLEPQEQNSFLQHNWEPPQKRRRKVFLHLRLAEILKTNGTGHMTSGRGPLFPGVNGSALPPAAIRVMWGDVSEGPRVWSSVLAAL